MPVRQVPSQSRRCGSFAWRKRFLSLVVFGVLCRAGLANAAENSPAQVAYEQGVEQFRAGNFEVACDLLANSYRLEPLPGVLFTWATCELRADRVASAAQHYAEFLDAVSRLPAAERQAQDERREVAQRERARILPEVPYLTVVMAPEAIRTATVHRDGVLLAPSSLGVEVPVDPGQHLIDFEGADGFRAQQRVVLAKREHKTIVLGFAKPREAPPAKRPAPESAQPKLYERKVTPWLYVSGGVGVAGLLTGSLAGLLAIRDKGVVKDECIGRACSQRGIDAVDAAKLESTVSTVGFGVGVAGVVATAILYIVDSGRSDVRVSAEPRWSVVAISPDVLGVGAAF